VIQCNSNNFKPGLQNYRWRLLCDIIFYTMDMLFSRWPMV